MQIKVGVDLPNVELYEGLEKITIEEICQGKRIMIIGVPGAFSPDCSGTHLPEYVALADVIKERGIDEIFCVSVNDPFVMQAWAESQQTDGRVRLLADPEGNFTKAIGLELKKTVDITVPIMGNIRSCRYNMVVIDGLVEKLEVEPEETGLTCTIAESVLGKL